MLVVAGRNSLVDGLAAVVSHVSVHNSPDSTGSGEATGGGYARQTVSWTSAAASIRDNVASLAHLMAAGQLATHYGLWSALTAGTFYGSVPVNGTRRFGSVIAADVTANTVTSNGHGFVNTDRIQVVGVLAGSVPAGLSASTYYFAVGVSTDTFQLSLTSGGAAVDITGPGMLFAEEYVAVDFTSSAGTLTTAAGALDLDATAIMN